ncbi:MAG: ATP-binding protein [Polyangiaceae bacterium]
MSTTFASGDAFCGRAEVSVTTENGDYIPRLVAALDGASIENVSYRFSAETLPGGKTRFQFLSLDDFMNPIDKVQESMTFLVGVLLGQVFPRSLFSHLAGPFILTAERSAIQLFAAELSAHRARFGAFEAQLSPTMAERSSDPLQRLASAPRRYSLPIQDGLSVATLWRSLRLRPNHTHPLADALEGQILGGTASPDGKGEIIFTPNGGPDLDLHIASSSVKSLAPLVLYLRHLANPGDFLIIDEPELNLHPDNQRRVARLLAQVANAGVKVMITTHSDYIIREINNLVMLNEDKDGKLREKHGYKRDMVLKPESVGAYLFDQERAHELKVTRSGFEVKTIDDEINKLNEVSQDLYFSLIEGHS